MRTSAIEELGTLAENNPLTGYEPNLIDNYHISETTDIFIQESSSDRSPSNLHDLEFDDYTIGRALSSPLFQEREDPASRRQAYHSLDESLLSSQSSSVGHVRTGRPVFNDFGSVIPNVRENPRRDSENEQIRILRLVVHHVDVLSELAWKSDIGLVEAVLDVLIQDLLKPSSTSSSRPCQHSLVRWLVGHRIDVGLGHVSGGCIPPKTPCGGVSHTVTELTSLLWLSHCVDVSLLLLCSCHRGGCHAGGWHAGH